MAPALPPAPAPLPVPAAAPAAVSAAPLETALAEVLAEVLGVDQVPVESNFFEDLGADSMTMTRFCARLRKRPDLPNVTIRDVYRYPTIKALAAALAPAFSAAPASALAAVLGARGWAG